MARYGHSGAPEFSFMLFIQVSGVSPSSYTSTYSFHCINIHLTHSYIPCCFTFYHHYDYVGYLPRCRRYPNFFSSTQNRSPSEVCNPVPASAFCVHSVQVLHPFIFNYQLHRNISNFLFLFLYFVRDPGSPYLVHLEET